MPTPSVLLCSDYLPPSDGGVERVVDKLATQLAGEGFDIAIYTLDTGGETEVLYGRDDLTVYRSPSIDLTETIGLQSQLSPAAITQFSDVVEDHDPDLIHVHNRFFFTSLIGVCFASRVDIPVVTTLHLGTLDALDGLGGVAARLYERTAGRLLVRNSDRVVAVSAAVAAHGRQLGARDDGIRVVPNGVDVETFVPSSDPSTGQDILFVGRLVRNKGPQCLIEALPSVLESHPDASLRIVGTGPCRETLGDRVTELGLEDRVDFLGFVDSVAQEMRAADIFCRPSLSEGMPLTLLEAMASGLPSVVTAVGGVPDVVTNRENGLLVAEPRSDQVASALDFLLANPTTADRIGTAAREYVVEHHSWTRRTQNIIDIYDELVETDTVSMSSRASSAKRT